MFATLRDLSRATPIPETVDFLKVHISCTARIGTDLNQTTSVPIPQFASLCGTLICELRNRKDTSNLLI